KTIRNFVNRCCPAPAQLMSVTASPGRTWPIFAFERELPVLVTAPATAFFRRGARFARLRGVVGSAPVAGSAHRWRQNDFRNELSSESFCVGSVDHVVVSIPVNQLTRNLVMKRWIPICFFLLLLALEPPALAQVKKVTADAKGIT